MNEFNLRDFIMDGFKNAVGRMADYRIILNAAGWLDKGVLVEDDLAELQRLIADKNTAVDEVEDVGIDVAEEVTDEEDISSVSEAEEVADTSDTTDTTEDTSDSDVATEDTSDSDVAEEVTDTEDISESDNVLDNDDDLTNDLPNTDESEVTHEN